MFDTRQQIYDLWVGYSQASTDNRNDQCKVKISKMDCIKKYMGIENKNMIIEEITNKRGRASYFVNRMILTSTVRSLHHKLAEKGINVRIGSVLNCKPFLITYTSAKEMALCLCKISLNTKFLFNSLILRAKKDEDEAFDSISDFFKVDCKCQRSFNGYYQWKCSKRLCKPCKDAIPAKLKCQSSDDIFTVDQFEVKTREYLKYNKNTKELETKTAKLTDRVSSQMAYRKLYKKLVSTRKNYIMHKYHVFNDKNHWPIVLSTTTKYGEIIHSDYSGNMSQIHKEET